MTDPATQPDTSSAAIAGDAAPPPRAFAQGTGVLLQFVGVILFLSTCCVCSASGSWEDILTKDEAVAQIAEKKEFVVTLRRMFDDPARAGLSMMVVFSTVGGLALAGFGLGLQSDKRGAAGGAVIAAGLWLAILLASGACLWIGDGGFFARLWNIFFTLIAIIVFGFTWAAWRQVRRHPPPPGLEILPPDFVIPKFGRH